MNPSPWLDPQFQLLLTETGIGTVTRSRLLEHLERACGKGSRHNPASLAWMCANAWGGTETDLLFLLVGLFYAAVDLADDILDGDLPHEPDPGQFKPPGSEIDPKARSPLHAGAATGDVHRLLLLLGRLVADNSFGGEDIGRKMAAYAELCRGGIAMWEGQEKDLRERNRGSEDPWRVIEEKSGNEGAAVLRAAARWCGCDPQPVGRFGWCFASAAQLRSDLEDLFTDARDWREARPTLPLQAALDHPVVGESVRSWLAGARTDPARIRELRGLLLHADLAQLMEEGEQRYLLPAAEVVAENGRDPALLPPLRAMVHETDRWKARLQPRGTLVEDYRLAERQSEAITTGLAFLAADPRLLEAGETIRSGPYAGLTAPTFGPLFALSGLGSRAVSFEAAKEQAALGDGRFFAGWETIPPDADTAGQILQHLNGELATTTIDRLLSGIGHDGNVPVWLGDPGPFWRGPCAGTSASAYLGLCRWLPPDSDVLVRVREQLATSLLNGAPSPYYTPRVAAGLALRALWKGTQQEHRCRLPETESLRPMLQTMADWQRLDGSFGDPFSTALLAPVLQALGLLRSSAGAVRAIVDAGMPDGGWPSIPLWLGLPWNGEPSTFGSRSITTAWAIGALETLKIGQLWRADEGPSVDAVGEPVW
jgi:hypothetical protein